MKRAEVWWIDFGEPLGSEPGYRRPAVVASSDRFNRSRISTVIVVPLTSNLALAEAPGNVALSAGVGGLDRDSVANVSQVTVVDRQRLMSSPGSVDTRTMRAIDDGLRLALGL